MTPQEIAMKMISACNTCQGTKCLYRTQCKGNGETCPLKEVAMILRAQEARIESLEAQLTAANAIIKAQEAEQEKLVKTNSDYYRLVNAFKQGYKPARATRKGRPIKQRVVKKKDPIEMDGDVNYAIRLRQKEEKLPMVLI